MLHRISAVALDINSRGQVAAAKAVDRAKQFWSSSLGQQAACSSAAELPDEMLPKWSCRLASTEEAEQFCERMTSLCLERISQVFSLLSLTRSLLIDVVQPCQALRVTIR